MVNRMYNLLTIWCLATSHEMHLPFQKSFFWANSCLKHLETTHCIQATWLSASSWLVVSSPADHSFTQFLFLLAFAQTMLIWLPVCVSPWKHPASRLPHAHRTTGVDQPGCRLLHHARDDALDGLVSKRHLSTQTPAQRNWWMVTSYETS